MKQDSFKRKCNQCGADLILVKTIVEKRDVPSPITTSIYRCSSKSCQEDIDKKTVARAKHYKEQEEARLKRHKNRSRAPEVA